MIGRRIYHTAEFELSADIIELHPMVAVQIMTGMIVLRAEMLFSSNVVTYVVDHPMFPVKEDGMEVPHYYLTVEYEDNVPVKAVFSNAHDVIERRLA